MMHSWHIVPIILLALSCNLDNVGIGTAYGARHVTIPLGANALIAVVTSAGTVLSMVAGHAVVRLVPPWLAHLAGACIIIGAGVWVTVQEVVFQGRNGPAPDLVTSADLHGQPWLVRLLRTLDNPFIADADGSGHIEAKEALLLGCALTLNNLANGLGAGMMGLNPVLLTIGVFAFSIITIWMGITAGYSLSLHLLGRLSGPLAGVMLVGLGLYELMS